MPFNPKLIEGEPAPLDENGEILLPEPLQQLADRLQREAQQLNDRYVSPGTSVASGSTVTASNLSRTAEGSVAWRALTVLLSCGLVILLVQRAAGPAAKPSRENPSSQVGPVVAEPSREATRPQREPSQPITHSAGSTELSDELLREVTGPELEGVLDLLESKASQTNPSQSKTTRSNRLSI